MTREEFVALSKVEVTYSHYTNHIEPSYMTQDSAKDEFVVQWLKDHKRYLVKAHSIDIENSNVASVLAEAKAKDLVKLQIERVDLIQKLTDVEQMYSAVLEELSNMQKECVSWKTDFLAAQEQAEQVEPLKQQIADLENELIKMKARMFDMLDKSA